MVFGLKPSDVLHIYITKHRLSAITGNHLLKSGQGKYQMSQDLESLAVSATDKYSKETGTNSTQKSKNASLLAMPTLLRVGACGTASSSLNHAM